MPDATNPQSFNRYSYVRNNPTNLVDPTGHFDLGSEVDGYNTNSEVYQYYLEQGWKDEDIRELFRIWENQYKDWWNLLLKAELNDIIDIDSNDFARFRRDGNGQIKLERASQFDFAGIIEIRPDHLVFGYWDAFYFDSGLDPRLYITEFSPGNMILVRKGFGGASSESYGYVAGTGVYRDASNPMPEALNFTTAVKESVGWFGGAAALFVADGPLPFGDALGTVAGGIGVIDSVCAWNSNRILRHRLSQYAYSHR